MNDDCKYLLCWIIPCLLLVLCIIGCCQLLYYKMNSKFVDAGYHQQQTIGAYGVVWIK
jgi:hypothetical protein